MKTPAVVISLAASFHLTNAFSLNEFSHFSIASSQTQLPAIWNDVPSFLSSTALSLRPQQAAAALFDDYQSILTAHPLPTKLVTGAILAITGDAVAQSRDKTSYSLSRGGSFAAFDVTYRAVQHYLFPAIVENFHGQYFLTAIGAVGLSQLANADVMAAMERALVNQLIVVPFFYYPVFFLFSGIQMGLNLEEGLERAKQNFFPLLKRNLLFWVPIQYAQFAFVPMDLQIPFLCVAGLIWTYILSILAGSTKKYETPESEEVYCVTMTEDECILPDDELIPIPDMYTSDAVVESNRIIEEETILPETVMIDDFGEVDVADLVQLTRNNTAEETLAR